MGLSQKDVVKYLIKAPPQHESYQILSAYIYAKSSRGNLPTETLSKLLSIQRKLTAAGVNFGGTSTVGRAFEAVRNQLIAVNRQYLLRGPAAFGLLGQLGTASSPDAIQAWTKATDGKIKTFPSEENSVGVDAGRLAGGRLNGANAGIEAAAPPTYQLPLAPVELAENELNEAIQASLDPTSQEKTVEELELEQGRSTLARLRLEMMVRQQAKEENDARVREEERLKEIEESEMEGESSSSTHPIPTEAPPSFDTLPPSTIPTSTESVLSTSTNLVVESIPPPISETSATTLTSSSTPAATTT